MNELDRRASDAGQQVTSTAGHLRKIAEELRGDDLSRPAAQLADRGAQTLEDIGRYLAQSKGDKLLADAERFGRQRPWVLASAGVALGLAGSRMLKASAARRAYNEEYDGVGESRSTAMSNVPDYGTRGVAAGSGVATSNPASRGVSPPVSPQPSTTSSGVAAGSDAATTVASRGVSPSVSPPPSKPSTDASKSFDADRLTRGDGS